PCTRGHCSTPPSDNLSSSCFSLRQTCHRRSPGLSRKVLNLREPPPPAPHVQCAPCTDAMPPFACLRVPPFVGAPGPRVRRVTRRPRCRRRSRRGRLALDGRPPGA